jgi:para-aminobenzoate synthetase
MGVVNILKTLAQSSGPSVTGILAGRNHFWVAFVVAGSLKAAYDLMLLAFFGGRVRPREDNSGEYRNDAASDSASDIAEDTEQGVIVSSEPVDSSTGRRHH